MTDITYPAFPILAIIGSVLVLIPLPWHFQAWNSGTCLYMIWTSLGLLNLAINSIIWRSTVINYAPVWCDISSRLIVGVSVAIPAASLCINRRLYKIATVSSVTTSRAQKKRAVIVDLAIGLGIPIVQMVLQFIVEGHRFNIFEEIGCYPYTYNTTLAYPLSIVWPVVIGLISAIYCILTLRAFMQRRAQFSEFVSATTSLTINRYFRLMALATVELLFTTPICAYGIYLNVVSSPVQPWKGFADAHYDYSRVGQYPSIIWRMSYASVVSTELTRWSLLFCALVFFGFFGFAAEARKNYYKGHCAIINLFGVSPPSPFNSASGFRHAPRAFQLSHSVGSLPVYMPRSTSTIKRDSISTFCEKNDEKTSAVSPSIDDFDSLPRTPSSTSTMPPHYAI
ncbi:pheromone A receptor-domain-containing protein [Hygrophoropsis aurantiaca]|uniref:Pheromone A receptor-domain-containing protein n=1 Tax=Hygrophoropsis aurantiaca TaxID=72124 RepID=A0ACB7ZU29_9AGAM|nr:pheromone A receptor-domain-containing protein [Hygrophoropsis aurantiaca]